MSKQQQIIKKCKRIEKLLSSGILVGFQQKVKASFEYLDAEDQGFFTLKDLTERGKRIFLELGVEVDHGPSFSVMDNFRQFDIAGKGRVRFEDLAISLIIRFLSYDSHFFDEHAHGLISSGISTVHGLLSIISQSEKPVLDTNPTLGTFWDTFHGIFYILQKKLLDSSQLSPMSQNYLAKVLKDSYFAVARELLTHLNISLAKLKETWTTLGHGNTALLDELCESKNDQLKTQIVWRKPRKIDSFGVNRRMSFEMTQASTLKSQRGSSLAHENPRRNSSRNWDAPTMRMPIYDVHSPFNDDVYLDSSLSNHQLALLRTIQKLLDNLLSGGNQDGTFDNAMYLDDGIEGQRRNSLSVAINRGLTNMFGLNGPSSDSSIPGQRFSLLGSGAHSSWLMNLQKLNEGGGDKPEGVIRGTSGAAPAEAELSQELMEAQDLLRRTMMRLEVLELIQMQMQGMEEEYGLNSQSVDIAEAIDGCKTVPELPIEIPPIVNFEDITDAIQEIRILVSKRGMDNMIVGSLLALPTAMLPLQDVEDNTNLNTSETKTNDMKSENPVVQSGRGTKKKTLQVSELINMMDTTTDTLSNQLVRKAELLQELGKWKLSVQMREEKLSETSVQIEQQHRVNEGSSTIGVEIQVLRDRIHAAEYLETELVKVKDRNVELGRKVKQLERALMLAQEEKEYGKVEADLRPIGDNGMTESEELVMKLKDEIADLRNANSRLQKEQQHRDIAAKHAEQRLKMCLQDNLALHQKLNRVEEELNSTKTEISDLFGQIEHQRDVEEERLQVARKLHTTEMLVTELRANLLEARAEAVQAAKLREELNLCETRVAKLIAATSEAEIEGESRLTSKQEIEELRATLQLKIREIRELTINLRSMERKAGEVRTVQARLEACQEEVNRYKVKVEQCAPMLAEVARLRGSARAAVRSLQEQDKTILTLEENNKQLRVKVTELSERLNKYENLDVKLHEAETECTRLSEIVSNDIPILKGKLKTVAEEKRQLEIQCRQLKKSGRQAAVVASGNKLSTMNGNENISKGK